MVFYVHADGRKEFKGCVLLYYTWPDGDDWLPHRGEDSGRLVHH